MRSSDPNFRQSADCRKSGSPAPKIFSRKRSVEKQFRSCFFCFSEVAIFHKTWKNIFLRKSNFSEVAFRLACELVSCHFSLLHSLSVPSPSLILVHPNPRAHCLLRRLQTRTRHKTHMHTHTHLFPEVELPGHGLNRLVKHLVIRGVRYSTTGLEKSKDKPFCTPDRTHNRIRSPRLAASCPDDKIFKGSWQARSVTSGKFGSEDCVLGSLS